MTSVSFTSHVLSWVRALPSLLFTSSVSRTISNIHLFSFLILLLLLDFSAVVSTPKFFLFSNVSTNHSFHLFSIQLHSRDSSLPLLSALCIQLLYFFDLSAKNHNFGKSNYSLENINIKVQFANITDLSCINSALF